MRPISPVILLAVVAVLVPAPASAMESCDDFLVSCRTVRVPLDAAEPAAGRVGLFVQRVRGGSGRGRRRTVMVLAGGPGQAVTPEFAPFEDPLIEPLLGRRDIVVFDARGTGRSGLIRCPELQRDPHLRATRAAAACARRLGARRGEYGIDEHVADLEAVRKALRIPVLDLVGTSYGTMVALRYAQAFPRRVGRMVLDSVVPPSGTSADGQEIFRAIPRVLRSLCGRQRCRGVTRDPVGDVAALVRRMRERGALRGRVVDARGRRRTAEMGVVGLLDILLEGDFNAGVREAIPSAVVAGLRGDAAPLLRLARLVAASAPPQQTVEFSAGAYAAGSCEVLRQLWDPAADPATRLAQAAAAVRALGDRPFHPFDAATVLDADYLALCLRWPAPLEPLDAASDELPNKPMLMISGAEDLRTPVEQARRLAAATPTARHLVVPRTGHSVVASDVSGCALRAAVRFLLARGRPVRRCRGPLRLSPPVPVAPADAGDVRRWPGLPRRVGVTIRAVDIALDDVALAIGIGATRGGGLRGGTFRARLGSVRLRRYEYVPGIRIDATPRGDGSLSIRTSGPAAARGRLRLSTDARLTGVVGGRRIRTRASAGPPQA